LDLLTILTLRVKTTGHGYQHLCLGNFNKN
jgi:hypothetical protein